MKIAYLKTLALMSLCEGLSNVKEVEGGDKLIRSNYDLLLTMYACSEVMSTGRSWQKCGNASLVVVTH